MKDAKIFIYTQAYNAEETLARAIESVLAQSYKNFIYYIVDNGSSDSTGSIIQKYAKNDTRVRYVRNEVNSKMLRPNHIGFFPFGSVLEGYDFLANLDADDEYAPDFLKKTLHYALEHNADLVCCGSDFIDIITKKTRPRKLHIAEDYLILEQPVDYDRSLAAYFEFARTIWAKLYKTSLIKRLELGWIGEGEVHLSNDLYFALEVFTKADKICIIKDVLHTYYVNNSESVIRQFNPNRLGDFIAIFDKGRDFLEAKAGCVSKENWQLLYQDYALGLDTVFVAIKGDEKLSAIEKIRYVCEMYLHERTKELFDIIELKRLESINKYLIEPSIAFLLKCTEIQKYPELAKLAARAFFVMRSKTLPFVSEKIYEHLLTEHFYLLVPLISFRYSDVFDRLQKIPEHKLHKNVHLLKLYVYMYKALEKSDCDAFELCKIIKGKFPKAYDDAGLEPYVLELLANHSALDRLSAADAFYLSNLVKKIIRGDHWSAFDEVIALAHKEIDNKHLKSYLELALYVCDKAKHQDGLILFDITLCRILIEEGSGHKAKPRLENLLKTLPDDEEIKELLASL